MPLNSRASKLLLAVFSGLAGRGVAALVPLLIMPSMLSYLGRDAFGVWMTALSITSMSLFADLGIGNGVVTRLSTCYGKRKWRLAQSYLSSAYFVLSAVALFLVFLVVAVFYSGIFSYWLSPSTMESGELYYSIILVTLSAFFIGIPVALIQRVQYAMQVAWKANVWLIISAAFSIVLAKLSMNIGLPEWQVVAVYAFTPLIVLFASAVQSYLFGLKNIRPRACKVRMPVIADLLRLGSKFLVLGILSSVALNIDAPIIADRLGLAAVTEFSLVAKIATVLSLIISVAYLPLWPANAEAFARGDTKWVAKATIRASLIGGVIVGLCGLALTFFIDEIMSYWLGQNIHGQTKLMGAFSIMAVMTAICSPYQMVSNSLGALKPQMLGWLLYFISTLLLKYYLLIDFGLLVVPIISAAMYFVFLIPLSIFGARAIILGGHKNIKSQIG